VRVAVVFSEHTFDVPAFHLLLREFGGVDAHIQNLDNLAADVAEALPSYDALVFYTMHRQPAEGTRRPCKDTTMSRTAPSAGRTHHETPALDTPWILSAMPTPDQAGTRAHALS